MQCMHVCIELSHDIIGTILACWGNITQLWKCLFKLLIMHVYTMVYIHV